MSGFFSYEFVLEFLIVVKSLFGTNVFLNKVKLRFDKFVAMSPTLSKSVLVGISLSKKLLNTEPQLLWSKEFAVGVEVTVFPSVISLILIFYEKDGQVLSERFVSLLIKVQNEI